MKIPPWPSCWAEFMAFTRVPQSEKHERWRHDREGNKLQVPMQLEALVQAPDFVNINTPSHVLAIVGLLLLNPQEFTSKFKFDLESITAGAG